MKKLILLITGICFVLAINAQQPAFEWVKALGGSSGLISSKIIKTDNAGNIYVCGRVSGSVDFDPGSGQHIVNSSHGVSNYDLFISKFDFSGNFIWVKTIVSLAPGTSYIGGAIPYDFAIDKFGNVYATGSYGETVDFDPGPGIASFTSLNAGSFPNSDVFVLKLNSNGNYQWAKSMGSYNADFGYAVAVDDKGNVHTTGWFSGTGDFDPGLGVYNLNGVGATDIFVSKINSLGNFVWAKQMGGTGAEMPWAITVSATGDVYSAGFFNDIADFDSGPGTYTLASNGASDAYISKLDISGNFSWAKSVGGVNGDVIKGLATDMNGDIYAIGSYFGTVDLDPGPGIDNHNGPGGEAFALKLNTSGNLIWAKSMSGNGVSYANKLEVDAFGNIYALGTFSGTVDFDPGTTNYNITSQGSSDLFISKLNTTGGFLWAKTWGNTNGITRANSINLDKNNTIYTTGSFENTVDFDPDASVFNLVSQGSSGNLFIHKMNQNNIIGLNEILSVSGISIYPNPNSGFFNIELQELKKNSSLEIYNVFGEKVYQQDLLSHKNSINLNFAPGLYFCHIIRDSSETITQKVIVN